MKKRTSQQQRATNLNDTPKVETLPSQKPFVDMTPNEARMWIAGVRHRLISKMQRERAYLERRAKRGVQTPTDDAYEADQLLEAELLRLLDAMENDLNECKEEV